MTRFQVPDAGGPWTCPFCPLLCDDLDPAVDRQGQRPAIDCALARAGLDALGAVDDSVGPCVDGRPVDLDAAIACAAQILGRSRQPLFAGLGTDVAGARALYPLACATGAICDGAGGAALMHGLRALQDRGQFTTTLAEVRTRADLIVFVGGVGSAAVPRLGERLGIGDRQVPRREIVVLGAAADDGATLARWSALDGVELDALPLHGDLFDTLAWLGALVARRADAGAPAALRALAGRLRAARYAVLVGSPARYPAQGALLVEAVHGIVGTLNVGGRAAALWLGGGQGAATVNQTFSWLSGLPLRSRAGPRGIEHQPLLFDAGRLLADGAVDALLWLSQFDAAALPPPQPLPMIVVAAAAQAPPALRAGVPTVFIPVATPGIGADGHLFRTDGTVLLPLRALAPDGRPDAATVLRRITAALPARADA